MKKTHYTLVTILAVVLIVIALFIIEIKTDGAVTSIMNRTYRDRHPEDTFYDMTADEAYWKGNDDGWTSGYKAGMEDGYHEGYEQGYRDGREGY